VREWLTQRVEHSRGSPEFRLRRALIRHESPG
jgi:hypothetical protein